MCIRCNAVQPHLHPAEPLAKITHMKRNYCLLLLLLATTALSASTHFNIVENPSADCDTLITTEGQTYICQIIQQNGRETTFTLCEDTATTTYAIPSERISIKKRAVVIPPEQHKPLRNRFGSFHTKNRPLTGVNNQWVSIDITQFFAKSLVLSYERQVAKGISYIFDAGVRLHDISPTGHVSQEYTEYVDYYFSYADITYRPWKPLDLGNFLPTFSANTGTSLRLYLNNGTKSSLFIQPGVAVFYHRGYKVSSKQVPIPAITNKDYTFDQVWDYDGEYDEVNHYRMEWDITQRASRVNLNTSLMLGYRFANHPVFTLDIGLHAGRNYHGIAGDIHYYGINNSFFRAFVNMGLKIR